jgi:hypothetical protein
MTRNFYLLFIVVAATTLIQAQSTATAKSICACSHSFFSIRPPFQNSTPENITLFYNDAPLRRECGLHGALQIVPFGGRSTRSKDLARFFTPNCSDTVIFADNQAFDNTILTNPNERDVNSAFFNIRTVVPHNFASSVTFRPRHSYAGVGFAWKQYFDWCQCDNPCPRWWFEVSFPIQWVKNDMHLTETIITQGTPPTLPTNTSVTEAFTGVKKFLNLNSTNAFFVTGQGWNYGKIDGSRTRAGIADIEVKLGYDFINNDCCHLDGYFGFVAPTGNKPNAEFVFEPIIGNNHHWAIMWGGSFGGIIWQGCNKDLRLEITLNGRYLFGNTQRRSFDLVGKPWSRYMLVYTTREAALAQDPVEAINYFTQKMKVTPHAQQHINSALIFDWCNLQFDIGYHFWTAQCERVALKNPLPANMSLPTLTNATNQTASVNHINRAITIKENFQGAETPFLAESGRLLTILESDLNLSSAAMPCALTHTMYGSIGYHADYRCLPLFFGIGGSYEWTPKRINTALNRWMVWGKIGVSI